MKGLGEVRPWRVIFSEAAISSKLPPRWTVAERRQSAAFHGMGSLSAKSTLKTPGP